MFRQKGESVRSVFILLFLNVAFFFFEHQDAAGYARFFSFDRAAVRHGQLWRLVTYQFTAAGQGWFPFPRALVLFFTLFLLYLLGSAIEEEWGTFHFVNLFLVSTVSTAAIGWLLDVRLLGSYFVNFTLLFVFAALFPDPTIYLFGTMPLRIRWLAVFTAVLLIFAAFFGGPSNIAALGGAVASYGYYLLVRERPEREPEVRRTGIDATAIRNGSRFVAMKRAIAAGSATDVDKLIAISERDVVPGVNVCPPADYKPDHADGYCIRCEGFSECAVRFLRVNRPAAVAPAAEAAAPPALEAGA